MRRLLILSFYASLVGAAFSLILNLLAVIGENAAFVNWISSRLIFGLFVLWIPLMVVIMRVLRFIPQAELWQNVFKGGKPWFLSAQKVLMLYAIAFFALASIPTENLTSASLSSFRAAALPAFLLLFFGTMAMAYYSALQRDMG